MLPNPLLHMDIKGLTGLLYLLEERNVSKAADRLFISQSAMSRLLNRLREAFGDPLFIRTANGMEPTVAALRLEIPVRQMLEQMSQLALEQEFVPAQTQRTFRIRTSHYQSQAYLPFIAERFYREAPNAVLETSTVTETSLYIDNELPVDLVLTSEFIPVPKHFEQRFLGYEEFGCIMSDQHPLVTQASISLDEYLSYKHVLVNIGGSAKVITDGVLGEHAKQRYFALKTPYFTAALETVGKTQLLLTSSRLLAERFKATFGLAIKPLPFEIQSIRYYMSWPKTVTHDAGGSWLRSLCEEVVKQHIPYSDHES